MLHVCVERFDTENLKNYLVLNKASVSLSAYQKHRTLLLAVRALAASEPSQPAVYLTAHTMRQFVLFFLEKTRMPLYLGWGWGGGQGVGE